ncbi:MAG: thioredoxin [Phycisphaerae bacterium]|nr:thioredoxin [Phycisphaerae bacterium]
MSELVQEVCSADFEELISKGVALVDFWAPWCGPCRMQVPVLEDLAGSVRGRVKFAKVNIDEVADIAERFGVQAIPTLLLFKDGNEIRRFIGVQTKEILVDAISSVL